MQFAYLPSPSTGVLHLGPIPLRAYAFCIIIGVFVAVWLGSRRWQARGGGKHLVADVAIWAVPFGVVGGRLYHVLTSYELYFGPGKNWVDAFKIWEGGLGIWGAIALGGLGAWIGCRRHGVPLPAFADAVAPGVALAQAIGRWGNWFNQELFGRPSTLPWALKIDPANRPDGMADVATYQPTFLYESVWNIGVALLVLWADRRFTLGHGRAFALYVAAYTTGRFWVEYLRIDEAHRIAGLRLNDWTSVVVFSAAVTYLMIGARRKPGREVLTDPDAETARVPEQKKARTA
ncbi:prolipoprotein diacylglyceryl transferase [Streptomyces longwoodensis]|uniref:prolipoprotein diacylglyceryl transferase n=1 Tax=Streptomyces longwoodensis TaxID=68231 RepID=UPI0033D012BF